MHYVENKWSAHKAEVISCAPRVTLLSFRLRTKHRFLSTLFPCTSTGAHVVGCAPPGNPRESGHGGRRLLPAAEPLQHRGRRTAPRHVFRRGRKEPGESSRTARSQAATLHPNLHRAARSRESGSTRCPAAVSLGYRVLAFRVRGSRSLQNQGSKSKSSEMKWAPLARFAYFGSLTQSGC